MANLSWMKIAVLHSEHSRRLKSNMTNEDRRAEANNSRFAQHMRKEKAAPKAKDGKEIWEFEYNRNVTKLSFLILIYLYTQDDNVISPQEKRSINKILDQKGAFLKSYDYDEITKHIDNLPDLKYVLKYIDENDVKDNIFKESISTVKELINKDNRYTAILTELEKQYI